MTNKKRKSHQFKKLRIFKLEIDIHLQTIIKTHKDLKIHIHIFKAKIIN
jgi:hypothetical protein